ncbi:hypothetical protein CJO78_20085 (plasmid) [Ralstonia solanacearum]|nr:hypothetical protein CJO78_20085 [Ralstonia solanacearum]AXW08093.1 hypothetical protein CJO82_19745 [Ralstonia solanacearum]AXW25884.1 hypothetical protein CJO86_20005 [Ralstonia solanacearum]AXW82794.1 hypothetical protein CJO98_20105 [Ralstonia solanacearum]
MPPTGALSGVVNTVTGALGSNDPAARPGDVADHAPDGRAAEVSGGVAGMDSPPPLQHCGMTACVMPFFLLGASPISAPPWQPHAPNAVILERRPERPSHV